METNNVASKPKERRLENTLIGFKVTSYNKKERTCNLSVTIKDEHGSDNTKLFKKVYVSALLNWNLLNSEDYKIGEYYESTIPSEDWKANPMQLIRYWEVDGNNKTEKYLLACVSERPALRNTIVDPLGGEMVDVVYRHHKKSNYRRYRNYATV